ncbi:hypothetical protein DFP78_102566 [Photobacterium lutimaris]|nr:hypothetical protein DFP78_102566 [Photobacterium lutimaris]
MRTMDDGRWTMDDGRWTMDDGRWTMGLCTGMFTGAIHYFLFFLPTVGGAGIRVAGINPARLIRGLLFLPERCAGF